MSVGTLDCQLVAQLNGATSACMQRPLLRAPRKAVHKTPTQLPPAITSATGPASVPEGPVAISKLKILQGQKHTTE
jgi:hypothetical protein